MVDSQKDSGSQREDDNLNPLEPTVGPENKPIETLANNVRGSADSNQFASATNFEDDNNKGDEELPPPSGVDKVVINEVSSARPSEDAAAAAAAASHRFYTADFPADGPSGPATSRQEDQDRDEPEKTGNLPEEGEEEE